MSVTDGLPSGEGAGLVEDHGVDLPCPLEVFPALDQDAALRALARPHEERRGRGHPEGAGAGYHDDRDEGEHGEVEPDVADVEPGQACDRRGGDDDRDEVGGDPVREALDGRPSRLRLFDQLDYLEEGGVLADLVGPQLQEA